MIKPEIRKGTQVRVTKWGREREHTGTVRRREGDTVYVAYHASFIEDELDIADVEALDDPTPEQAAWEGGAAIATPDGWVTVAVNPDREAQP